MYRYWVYFVVHVTTDISLERHRARSRSMKSSHVSSLPLSIQGNKAYSNHLAHTKHVWSLSTQSGSQPYRIRSRPYNLRAYMSMARTSTVCMVNGTDRTVYGRYGWAP